MIYEVEKLGNSKIAECDKCHKRIPLVDVKKWKVKTINGAVKMYCPHCSKDGKK